MWVNVMNKKANKIVVIIFIFVFLLLVIPVGVKIYMDMNKAVVEEEVSRIDYYGYSLSTNDTKIYKNLYKELDKTLSSDVVDYNVYASLVSRMFLIDLFTLNNKLASTDIGGLEFIHKDLESNYRENMGATLYNHVLSNIDGKRTQKLPIVKDVTVDSVFETKYKYKDVEYDSYIVKCNILYEEDLGYQSSATLTLIKDDKILYVVKGE